MSILFGDRYELVGEVPPFLFRYSGNKSRLVQYYRRPGLDRRRVVELYLGSGSYFMSQDIPGLGYEANGDVVAMWRWLQTCTPSELRDLYYAVEDLKVSHVKPDVRLLKLGLGAETYVRVNVTGVYTGQLTAWGIYPQHKLPVESTIQCLPRIRDMEVVHGSASSYEHRDGDILFVDPPYVGTTGGYMEKGKKCHETDYSPSDTVSILDRTDNPVIFTYGDGAEVCFPKYEWSPVLTRKVANIRRGGTVDRTEWVSYINWGF